jgi:adenylate kinase
MSKIIVLLGAPGAGKGTQARLLQEKRGLPQISTGDIFRAMAQADTPLANEVRQIQSSGKLIPDDLVIKIVEERTSQEDCRNGYILDGFPRTTPQAERLDELARKQKHTVIAISIDIAFDLLERRATGRRTCPVCGEIYNIHFKPPKNDGVCDLHPEAKLLHRSDDDPEKIKVRLQTYEENTKPLLDYYAAKNLLVKVNGTGTPQEIYSQIERVLGSS